MGKIIQTAGRNALGEFAPEFAHFNDDVLFGENWNNQDIDVKTRSIITVVALMASGLSLIHIFVSILDERAGEGGRYHEEVMCALPSCKMAKDIKDVQHFIRNRKGVERCV